ncbi:putative phage protein [Escherichia coli]|nr:putative phage protein [Escherichia coli]GDL98292.1 putative phage protein [Escherichia coli]GDO63362.1 putative phage protein [Escherichia coli]
MTTITKDRLLTIQHWRETYGPGSNVVLPAEEAEELARIALASLAAVSDERAAYELFMEKRFGESLDRRRAKNGDRDYMVWDMALGWIIWCHRAAMLQAGNFREYKGSSTNNFREISETSTNYPVTPDGWISCSERMPDDGQHVIILCDGAFVLYAQYRDGEFLM